MDAVYTLCETMLLDVINSMILNLESNEIQLNYSKNIYPNLKLKSL